jgi:hypothetical protein
MARRLEAHLQGDIAIGEPGIFGLALEVVILEELPIVQVVEDAVDYEPPMALLR